MIKVYINNFANIYILKDEKWLMTQSHMMFESFKNLKENVQLEKTYYAFSASLDYDKNNSQIIEIYAVNTVEELFNMKELKETHPEVFI